MPRVTAGRAKGGPEKRRAKGHACLPWLSFENSVKETLMRNSKQAGEQGSPLIAEGAKGKKMLRKLSKLCKNRK